MRSRGVFPNISLWILIVLFVCASFRQLCEAQFRAEENRERYLEPYRRASTESPYRRRFNQDPVEGTSDQRSYHPSEGVRYRGYNEYYLNERGSPGYGGRNIDRFRLNYEHRQEFQDYELKNTIFDVWRPDLQGEKRPGETPGVNLPLAEDVFVSTDTGKVQGFYIYLYDRPEARFDEQPANKPLELQRHYLNVTAFLGIPYAQPPTWEGRFKPPRRVRNWHTTWQAIDYSPACPQNLKYVGATKGIRNGIDEDCLYLNIFTPSLSVNAREKYPVMFYIHGGDFDHGSGSQFPGHMLSAWGEVVVVTFNYRLGALGFLSTGDYHSPGNYGLMDMALALEWVYENIRFFNGDRHRITAFGAGAGGAAAGLLAVLPKSRDYVSQVLGQSGSPLADWATIDDVYRVQNTSRVFGLEMGCNVDSSYNIINCLVNRDYEEIATAVITPDVGTFPWSPVVDGNLTVPEDSWYEDWSAEDWHIMPEMPIHMYMRNEHHPLLKYLTGVNRDEGANLVFNDPRLQQTNMIVNEEFFNDRIKEWVKHYNYSLNPEGAYDAIKWMYTFWPDPHNVTHIREQYVHMLSDALYKSGVDQIVKVLTNTTSKKPVHTYYYVLNTTVEALKLPYWREVPNNIEFYFASGAPFMDPDFYPENIRVSRHQWTEGDRNISMFMMKAWANFAKWGNPTQEQIYPIKVNWERTVQDEFKHLSINNTFNTTMHYNYRQTEATFWYDYMPRVVREWIPTPPPPKNPWLDMTEPVTATMYALIAVVVAMCVVLCVCCGMWKSAKRQRNKALDDLSYYSVENLSMCNGNEYGVRSYLEKLNKSQPLSRTGTLNTVLTTEPNTILQTSRPETPNTGTGVGMNGKVYSISEPDHLVKKTHYPIPLKRGSNPTLQEKEATMTRSIQSELGLQNTDKVSLDQPLSIPELINYTEEDTVKYTRVPQQGHQNPHPPVALPRQTVPERDIGESLSSGAALQHNIIGLPPPPPQPKIQNPNFAPLNGIQSSVGSQNEPLQPYPTVHPHHLTMAAPHLSHPEPNQPSSRPITPNSAVTFDIYLKPSKSIGTISDASGMILNTDL